VELRPELACFVLDEIHLDGMKTDFDQRISRTSSFKQK
jgi:hypothetical protein